MRKIPVLTALLVLSPAALGALPQHARAVYREGEVLVTYRDGADTGATHALKARFGLASGRRLLGGRVELLTLPGFATTAGALALLRDEPAVAWAEPNYLRYPRAHVLPDDTYFGDQWGLHSTGQANFVVPGDPSLASIPGADMDMIAAWDPDHDGIFDRVGDGTTTIAIIDDSVNTTHPDLEANIVQGRNFVPGQDPDNPNPVAAGEEHGTLVAGAAGAVGNNGIGVAGTAWNVRLMPLKFDYDIATHIAAMEFARDNGAHIVNASFGGPFFAQAELDAVRDLAANGILYVAAAGNDDSNTDVAQLNYPANFDSPNVVSVAATNRQDNIASFSQYGAITTDVAAPGLQIVTTSNSAYTNPFPVNAPCSSCGVTGTSFSAPYVAGVAALIRSLYPSATHQEIKARLIEGAEPAGEVNLRTAGGRVNAANSLSITARPALVIKSVDWVDANGALDPGESLSVDIALDNLWQGATGVSGTLAADNHVTVTSGAVAFGNVAEGGSATGRFDLTVDSPITGHRYVHFTLTVTADGGYSATRGFIAEIGRLETDVLVTQTFAARDVDLYDEFHAWHYDLASLPEGHTQLVIHTTSAASGVSSPDLDLLVKRGEPPRYSITVGINPEFGSGFFCTSATTSNCQDPAVYIDADFDGDETVVINNPPAGTYHIVIVNFAQLSGGMTYTLRAYTRAGSVGASLGVGSGGAPAPLTLLLFLVVAAGRRARFAA